MLSVTCISVFFSCIMNSNAGPKNVVLLASPVVLRTLNPIQSLIFSLFAFPVFGQSVSNLLRNSRHVEVYHWSQRKKAV